MLYYITPKFDAPSGVYLYLLKQLREYAISPLLGSWIARVSALYSIDSFVSGVTHVHPDEDSGGTPESSQ